ncbi:TonB-dependent receptor [bacterium]|nr:TonB-dependent receptor [bacterium]
MNSGKLTKTILCLIVVALLAPGLIMAATGKIRGTVVDAETKAPLFGANVIVGGSQMGAATDVNGNFIILNVPAGVYAVQVMYMGYAKMTVENIIVAEGVTTFRDFELSKAVLEGQEVVIIAERPLIVKGETNDIQRLSADQLQNMPVRGVNDAVASMAGVVESAAGDLHVRGGRDGEMAYYVDGVNVTRPRAGDNDNRLIIQNAVSLVQTQTGGFNASYGGRMSGITQTTMKSGGPKYKITGELVSDDFWAVQDDRGAYEILGIDKLYSFGYNDYTLTLSGPVVPGWDKISFFAAGNIYNNASNASWFEGFQQDSMSVPYSWRNRSSETIHDTLDLYMDYAPGRIPGNTNYGWSINSNLVFNFKPFRVRYGLNYAKAKFQRSEAAPTRFLQNELAPWINDRTTINTYLNMTHSLDPNTFYTLSLSYYDRFSENYDKRFGTDLDAWGNPETNPALLDKSMGRAFPLPFEDAFRIQYPGSSRFNAYSKDRETRYSFKFDITRQIGQSHQAMFGIELQQENIRRFSIAARSYHNRMTTATYQDETKYTEYDRYAGLALRLIGYDWMGEEVNDNTVTQTLSGVPTDADGNLIKTDINLHNKPMTPVMASVYLKDEIELKDMILNLGVRVDHFRNGFESINDWTNLTQAPGTVMSDEDFGKEKQYTYITPRLGFSFPVTDRAVFHAQYGKYVQPVNTDFLWGRSGFTGLSSQIFNTPFFSPQPNPNLEPEKQTTYEFGFQMQFGDNASLDVTAYYKDVRDLITIRRMIVPLESGYTSPDLFTNGDFSTVRGFTTTFNMRRTSRVQTQIMYTYTVAHGTGSDAQSHRDIAWQETTPFFPKVVQTLDFDIRHAATAVIDVRTKADDGPEFMGMYPLGNIGANFKFDVSSGAPYTAIGIAGAYSSIYGFNAPTPLGAPNSSRLPWFMQLDAKITKSFTVGPLKMQAYLWALNLLNSKSITNFYQQTGRPDTDGWLLTDEGQTKLAEKTAAYGDDWLNWYEAVQTNCGSFGWQAPRQVRFGVRFAI